MPVTKSACKALTVGVVLVSLALGLAGSSLVATSHAVGPLYRVVNVVDGDTIVLENGERVRYLGIDTPETSDPGRGIECYGPEATERNRHLVEDRLVRLEADQSNRDRYGRLLRYVYVDDLFVNGELVEEGYAYTSYWPPDTRYYQELLALESQARAAGRGLWSACQR